MEAAERGAEPIEDGVCLVEGDIVVPCADVSTTNDGVGSTSSELAVVRDVAQLWPSAIVPFVIDPALPNPARVHQAIRHWQTHTPLRFSNQIYGVTPGTDYVYFTQAQGCWSSIGRQGRGRQNIGLADGCDVSAVIHEIGHAVGLFHTQARADRDQHVIIHWANIEPGKEHNFETYPAGYDLGPYDVASIMHYSSYSFSANGQPTIVTRNGSLIKDRTQLSSGDQEYLATLYCPEVGYRYSICSVAHDYPYTPPVVAETRIANRPGQYNTAGYIDLGTATAVAPTVFVVDGVRIRNFDTEVQQLHSARFEGPNASAFFVNGIYRPIAAGGTATLSVGARNLNPGRTQATLVVVIRGNWAPTGERFPRDPRTMELRIQVTANALSYDGEIFPSTVRAQAGALRSPWAFFSSEPTRACTNTDRTAQASRTFFVNNHGTGSFVVRNARIVGPDASAFRIRCLGSATVQSGGSLEGIIEFRPMVQRPSYQATMEVDTAIGTLTAALSGTYSPVPLVINESAFRR